MRNKLIIRRDGVEPVRTFTPAHSRLNNEMYRSHNNNNHNNHNNNSNNSNNNSDNNNSDDNNKK